MESANKAMWMGDRLANANANDPKPKTLSTGRTEDFLEKLSTTFMEDFTSDERSIILAALRDRADQRRHQEIKENEARIMEHQAYIKNLSQLNF